MEFTVNELFGDNMVLQRDTVISLFGEGKSGTEVKVEIQNQTKITRVTDGCWRIDIGPLSVSFKEELKVAAENDIIEFVNVAVGEVYLLAGQSNIEFEFYQSESFDVDLPHSSNDAIRYLEIPRIEYREHDRDYPDLRFHSWQLCDQNTAPVFSAIGLYFAQFLNHDINVPIGLVSLNKGGSSASCWMNEEYLKKDDQVANKYIKDYYEGIANQTDHEEDLARAEYARILSEYQLKIQEYQETYPNRTLSQLKKDVGHTPWPPPKGEKDAFRPSGLYETMFARIKDWKFKSVIYYQGEEDTRNGEIYDRLLSLLIANWRADFQAEIPFVIVALPEYNDDKNDKWPLVRANQAKVCQTTPKTYLVVSLNCGEEFNIHPRNKKGLAYRVFARVKEAFYDPHFNGHAPTIVEAAIKGLDLVLEFDQEIKVSGAAPFTVDGKIVESMQVAPNKLAVPFNRKAQTVSYCYENYCKSNIWGLNGLPAGGFKLDLAKIRETSGH